MCIGRFSCDQVGTATGNANWIFQIMDHRVRESAGHTESFRAHCFAHEMVVYAADPRRDGAQKIHVQAAGGKFENLLKRVFRECAISAGSTAVAVAECGSPPTSAGAPQKSPWFT